MLSTQGRYGLGKNRYRGKAPSYFTLYRWCMWLHCLPVKKMISIIIDNNNNLVHLLGYVKNWKIQNIRSLWPLVIETVQIVKMTVTFFVFEDFHVISNTLNRQYNTLSIINCIFILRIWTASITRGNRDLTFFGFFSFSQSPLSVQIS